MIRNNNIPEKGMNFKENYDQGSQTHIKLWGNRSKIRTKEREKNAWPSHVRRCDKVVCLFLCSCFSMMSKGTDNYIVDRTLQMGASQKKSFKIPRSDETRRALLMMMMMMILSKQFAKAFFFFLFIAVCSFLQTKNGEKMKENQIGRKY